MCIKSQVGDFSYEKCTVVSDYCKGIAVLKDLNCPKRTNKGFMKQLVADHHTGVYCIPTQEYSCFFGKNAFKKNFTFNVLFKKLLYITEYASKFYILL